MKKIRKRYRLGTLVAGIFLTVCALLAAGMPGASAASTSAQPTSSPLTTVKFADSAVAASAATRSTPPPSRRRGSGSCVQYISIFYPKINSNAVTPFCNLPGLTQRHDLLAYELSLCIGGLIFVLKVSPEHAMAGCYLAATPGIPFNQEQWCENTTGTACLNAWGGGPWVDDYTGGTETADSYQNFYLSAEYNASGHATGYYQIIYDGLDTSWRGQCIGDAYNNSGYADTSLDPCGSASGGQGWGTNMIMGTSGCPSEESWFYDAHWGGYLGPPAGAVNGSHFYLNKPTPYCFNAEFVG